MTYPKEAELEALIDDLKNDYFKVNTVIGTSAGANGTYSSPMPSYTINTVPNTTLWTTSPYMTNGTNWNTIGTGATQPTIKVSGDAEFEGRVKINGKDLAEFMETMSKRLAILVPDPEKLEHFEALKKAYDHYKLLEALCELPKETKE